MGAVINPKFLSAYDSLKSAALNYNAVVKQYGENSAQARSAFEARQRAESIFTAQQGIISNSNSNQTEDSLRSTIDGYMNQVKSWYV